MSDALRKLANQVALQFRVLHRQFLLRVIEMWESRMRFPSVALVARRYMPSLLRKEADVLGNQVKGSARRPVHTLCVPRIRLVSRKGTPGLR
jgi:hypothetical protein